MTDRLEDLIISGRLGPDGKPLFGDQSFEEFQFGMDELGLIPDKPTPDVEVIDVPCGCGGS